MDDARRAAQVAGRPLQSYWSQLRPAFAAVWLPPRRRADGGGVGWAWTEPPDAGAPGAATIAAVRRRLLLASENFSTQAASGAESLRDINEQIELLVERWERMPDAQFAGYLAHTTQGWMMHSWGCVAPLSPSYEDEEPAPVAAPESVATPVAPKQRNDGRRMAWRIGMAVAAVIALSGGLWAWRSRAAGVHGAEPDIVETRSGEGFATTTVKNASNGAGAAQGLGNERRPRPGLVDGGGAFPTGLSPNSRGAGVMTNEGAAGGRLPWTDGQGVAIPGAIVGGMLAPEQAPEGQTIKSGAKMAATGEQPMASGNSGGSGAAEAEAAGALEKSGGGPTEQAGEDAVDLATMASKRDGVGSSDTWGRGKPGEGKRLKPAAREETGEDDVAEIGKEPEKAPAVAIAIAGTEAGGSAMHTEAQEFPGVGEHRPALDPESTPALADAARLPVAESVASARESGAPVVERAAMAVSMELEQVFVVLASSWKWLRVRDVILPTWPVAEEANVVANETETLAVARVKVWDELRTEAPKDSGAAAVREGWSLVGSEEWPGARWLDEAGHILGGASVEGRTAELGWLATAMPPLGALARLVDVVGSERARVDFLAGGALRLAVPDGVRLCYWAETTDGVPRGGTKQSGWRSLDADWPEAGWRVVRAGAVARVFCPVGTKGVSGALGWVDEESGWGLGRTLDVRATVDAAGGR